MTHKKMDAAVNGTRSKGPFIKEGYLGRGKKRKGFIRRMKNLSIVREIFPFRKDFDGDRLQEKDLYYSTFSTHGLSVKVPLKEWTLTEVIIILCGKENVGMPVDFFLLVLLNG